MNNQSPEGGKEWIDCDKESPAQSAVVKVLYQDGRTDTMFYNKDKGIYFSYDSAGIEPITHWKYLHQPSPQASAGITKEGEWISVEDKLPDTHIYVLVWVPSRKMPFMATRANRGLHGEQWESVFSEIFEGISHWMKLPNAPKPPQP